MGGYLYPFHWFVISARHETLVLPTNENHYDNQLSLWYNCYLRFIQVPLLYRNKWTSDSLAQVKWQVKWQIFPGKPDPKKELMWIIISNLWVWSQQMYYIYIYKCIIYIYTCIDNSVIGACMIFMSYDTIHSRNLLAISWETSGALVRSSRLRGQVGSSDSINHEIYLDDVVFWVYINYVHNFALTTGTWYRLLKGLCCSPLTPVTQEIAYLKAHQMISCCFLLKLEYYSSENLLKFISNKTHIELPWNWASAGSWHWIRSTMTPMSLAHRQPTILPTEPAWVSNHMSSEVSDEITDPFLYGCPVEVWEWINNFITHFIMDVITYPYWNKSKSLVVKRASGDLGEGWEIYVLLATMGFLLFLWFERQVAPWLLWGLQLHVRRR